MHDDVTTTKEVMSSLVEEYPVKLQELKIFLASKDLVILRLTNDLARLKALFRLFLLFLVCYPGCLKFESSVHDENTVSFCKT